MTEVSIWTLDKKLDEVSSELEIGFNEIKYQPTIKSNRRGETAPLI